MSNTSFGDVFDVAIWKFRDRDIVSYNESDREAILGVHLLSASSHAMAVTGDESFDIDYKRHAFKTTLTNEQIDIVATGIAYEWYNRKVLNSETIRNRLSNKDYSNHSPGTLLEAMVKLRDQLKYEWDVKLIEYSMRYGDVSKWTAQ